MFDVQISRNRQRFSTVAHKVTWHVAINCIVNINLEDHDKAQIVTVCGKRRRMYVRYGSKAFLAARG